MRLFKGIIFLIFINAVFFFGFWLGKSQEISESFPPINQNREEVKVDLSLFWETWQRLEEKYIDKGKLSPQEMLYGAIAGMVKALKDPYTVFFKPEEVKRFFENVAGEFEGVGMEIGIKKGELLIISPLEGTPAFKAGLKAGDKILKIDDTFTADLSLEEAVDLIRGPKGTTVTLTIFRQEWEEPREISIVRDLIKVPSLRWELQEGDIAYLKLYHFTERADFDFRKTAIEILNSPASRIILDLRNNPGGYLEVARDIAGWFLEKGKVVAIEDFGEGGEKEYKSPGPSKLVSYPIVVLINQGSASGSEILAAALRDNRGVKLIGERSFGKGSVQEVEKLSDRSALKITVAHWLTPKGKLIEGVGLEPDIYIKMTQEDYLKNRDPQLEKAIEVIKSLR